MSAKLCFDPKIEPRERRLPAWVEPRFEGSGAQPLNASATALRELCDRRRTIFEIVDALRERFVADDRALYVDVTSALVRLPALGLVAGARPETAGRPPVKFLVGVEDRAYFHWQLPILCESLIGQLPAGWGILAAVCNDHAPLSKTLLRIFESYGVTYFTGADHPTNVNMDFAGGGERYGPFNRIEALRAAADHVSEDDVVFLLDADNFLYRELDPSIFPSGNALCENWIIGKERFFGHKDGPEGIDLHGLLESIGCPHAFQPGGVAVFLTGATLKNAKFVQDCFRFAQVVYLLGKIAGPSDTWVSEMPCFALSLTANGISYDVIDSKSFSLDKEASIPAGTLYHYYSDLKDSGVDGAFYDSDWHKQLYFHTDFLRTDIEPHLLAAVTDHERYFFELARRAQWRLYASRGGGDDREGGRG